MISTRRNRSLGEQVQRCARCGDSQTQLCKACDGQICANCTSELHWGLGVCRDRCAMREIEYLITRKAELEDALGARTLYWQHGSENFWHKRWSMTFNALCLVVLCWGLYRVFGL